MKAQYITVGATLIGAILIVLPIGFAMLSFQYGAKGVTMQGTISSQEDSGLGFRPFGFCMSAPNCGYTTYVHLANGTEIHYVDTCIWNAGTRMNFTYWSRMGWQQDAVVCD